MLKAFSVCSVCVSVLAPPPLSNPSQAGFWEKLFSSKVARTPRCRPRRVLTQTRAQTNTFLTPRSDPVVFIPAQGCSIIPLGFWSSDNQSEFSESPWTAGRGQNKREFKWWFSPRNTFFFLLQKESVVLFYFYFFEKMFFFWCPAVVDFHHCLVCLIKWVILLPFVHWNWTVDLKHTTKEPDQWSRSVCFDRFL